MRARRTLAVLQIIGQGWPLAETSAVIVPRYGVHAVKQCLTRILVCALRSEQLKQGARGDRFSAMRVKEPGITNLVQLGIGYIILAGSLPLHLFDPGRRLGDHWQGSKIAPYDIKEY